MKLFIRDDDGNEIEIQEIKTYDMNRGVITSRPIMLFNPVDQERSGKYLRKDGMKTFVLHDGIISKANVNVMVNGE